MADNENEFENTFSYIDDENLRKHMWDALEFISDLLWVADNFSENNRNYFYKTSILYMVSIIESHIHFCIIKLWYKEYISKNWLYKNITVLFDCKETNLKIMSWNREKEIKNLDWNVDFYILNTFANKNAKIYNDWIYNKIEKVRKLRNQIHLMKLTDIDRKYSKKQLNEVFEIARELFKIIENKLISLS